MTDFFSYLFKNFKNSISSYLRMFQFYAIKCVYLFILLLNFLFCCRIQHSGWERPETGASARKGQTRIIWRWRHWGLPALHGGKTPFSPHFYYQKSREIIREWLYWGVWSAHHNEGVKLRLCCWSGASCFVSMGTDTGAGSEAEQRARPAPSMCIWYAF